MQISFKKRKEFLGNLRAIREGSSLDIITICKELGILPEQLYRYEQGKETPGTAMLVKLAGLYEVDLSKSDEPAPIEEPMPEEDKPQAQDVSPDYSHVPRERIDFCDLPEVRNFLGKIKELRKAKGLSLKNLNLAANIGAAVVQKIEAGETQYPTKSTIFKLAKFFGVSLPGMEQEVELPKVDAPKPADIKPQAQERVRVKPDNIIDALGALLGISGDEVVYRIARYLKSEEEK